MNAVTIVVTSWLASSGLLYVREALDLYDASSTAVTLIGVLLTSMYGPHVDAGPRSTSELYSYFFRAEFLLFMTILLVVLSIGWGVDCLRGREPPLPLSAATPPLLPTSTADAKGPQGGHKEALQGASYQSDPRGATEQFRRPPPVRASRDTSVNVS